MERIGGITKSDAHNKSLTRTSKQPPPWGGLLLTVAQSKSKELTAGEIKLWEIKLKDCQPEEVEEALLAYNGPFFPDPGLIVTMIQQRRELKAIERRNQEWPAWKAAQAEARKTGQLATEEQYAELRAKLRQVAARTPEGGKRCYQEK